MMTHLVATAGKELPGKTLEIGTSYIESVYVRIVQICLICCFTTLCYDFNMGV